MAYNYSNADKTSWDPKTSATMIMLQNDSDANMRQRYLTSKPYVNYTGEFNDLLNSRFPDDIERSIYVYFAALGGRLNGATKYIVDYIVLHILPNTVPKKIYVNLKSVVDDINKILSENQYVLYDIIEKQKSVVTPFIEDICDTYFGYVFGKRLKVMNCNNLKNYKLTPNTFNPNSTI